MIGIEQTGFSKCITNGKYCSDDLDKSIKNLSKNNDEIVKNIAGLTFFSNMISQENNNLNKIVDVTGNYYNTLLTIQRGYIEEDQAVKNSVKFQ